MQFTAVTLSIFASLVAAQQDTLPLTGVVSQLPTCAIPCFESGASAAGCLTTDFNCLCVQGHQEFITTAGSCLVTKCQGDDFNNAVNSASKICDIIATHPNPSDVASASSVVTSVLGAASASASASATTTPVSAASRSELGLGIFGAAAAAMWIL
ncbi:hypothetical protein GGS21DRAFT_23814 [Xylaria nigripes]|nr:hypothetical protein GGS21DRAFT_23814 [Xylaria nigripes]